MNLYLELGNRRAADLRAEAQHNRLSKQLKNSASKRLALNWLALFKRLRPI